MTSAAPPEHQHDLDRPAPAGYGDGPSAYHGKLRTAAWRPSPCHPEAIRVSHGAPIEDHAATETRANVVRAAAGLPARRRYTRAA